MESLGMRTAQFLALIVLFSACSSEENLEPSLLDGRTFQTIAPDSLSDESEIVLVLHGYSSDADEMITVLELEERAEEQSVIFVVPDGLEDSTQQQYWNAEGACCDIFNARNDDVAFLRALIEQTVEDFNGIDRPIFAIGHSNGGFMSHRLACNDETGLIEGIATVAGALPTLPDEFDCSRPPESPLRVVHVHGTSDEVIAYGGSDILNQDYPSAVQTAQFWAGHLGCDETLPGVSDTKDLDASQEGIDTDVFQFACPTSSTNLVEHWRTNDGLHVPDPTEEYIGELLNFLRL